MSEKIAGISRKITLSKICALVALLVIGYEVLFFFKAVVADYPLEYRENAMILTTDLLLKCQNPYAFESQPTYTNGYGILSHIAVYPLARLFGCSFFVHRMVSIVFILLSLVLIILTLRRRGTCTSLIISASGLFLYHMVRANAITAFPNAQGQFLFLASILLPFLMGFSWLSLIVSVIFSVLAVVTKPYFVFGFPILVVYLFLAVSKRRALIVAGLFMVIMAVTVWLLNLLFPAYFHNTFFAYVYSSPHSVAFLFKQVHDYFDETFALVIICFLAVCGWIIDFLREKGSYSSRVGDGFLDFRNPDEGLLKIPLDIVFVGSLIIMLLLIRMGQRHGRFFGYFAELLTPLLLVIACPLVEIVSRPGRSLMFSAIFFLNVFLILFSLPDLPPANKQSWSEWEDIIAQKSQVYACDPLAFILSGQGKKVYVAGQSEFFHCGLVSCSPAGLYSTAEGVLDNFCRDLKSKVRSDYFDLIIIRSDERPFWDDDNTIEKFYGLKETRLLPMPKKWNLQLWEPIPVVIEGSGLSGSYPR